MLSNPKVVAFFRLTVPILCMVFGWFIVTLWDEKDSQLQKVEIAAEEFNELKKTFITQQDLHVLALKVEKNVLLVERLSLKVDTLITYLQELRNATPASEVEYAGKKGQGKE